MRYRSDAARSQYQRHRAAKSRYVRNEKTPQSRLNLWLAAAGIWVLIVHLYLLGSYGTLSPCSAAAERIVDTINQQGELKDSQIVSAFLQPRLHLIARNHMHNESVWSCYGHALGITSDIDSIKDLVKAHTGRP